jgi:hypothetical protein
MSTPPSTRFKAALVEDGILFRFRRGRRPTGVRAPAGLGVHFTQEPAATGPVTTAVLDDACGDLIQTAAQETTG